MLTVAVHCCFRFANAHRHDCHSVRGIEFDLWLSQPMTRAVHLCHRLSFGFAPHYSDALFESRFLGWRYALDARTAATIAERSHAQIPNRFLDWPLQPNKYFGWNHHRFRVSHHFRLLEIRINHLSNLSICCQCQFQSLQWAAKHSLKIHCAVFAANLRRNSFVVDRPRRQCIRINDVVDFRCS